ncbi:MAG: FAD-dependent oxidoreductase [Candidatus Brocadiia bacterium]
MPDKITEPPRELPFIADVDVCVLGGSCTGVFAAVRAARRGKSVVVLEATNGFGGTATNGLVNVWHSTFDSEYEREIIGGLTTETMDRLDARGAAAHLDNNPNMAFRFNSAELKLELDKLVREHDIEPMLHTRFCAPVLADDGTVEAVLVENKDGRAAIRAKVFVDATGDGDLVARAGLPFRVSPELQPPTMCGLIWNFAVEGLDFQQLYDQHHEEFGLEPDSGWSGPVPGLPGITMFAHAHVFGVNCADAAELTAAEMKGRAQIRAVMDMLRKYGPQGNQIGLVALPSYIGIRETRRFEAEYELTEDDVLSGRRFDDAIAQGSYRVDVHHPEGGGFLFKYLDGTTLDTRSGERGRWREPTSENPTFYQIPYRCLVHRELRNVIMAGRMIAADTGAYGAIRVMVNLNQTGEAAGVAACLAAERDVHVADVKADTLRKELREGGSIIL